LHPTPLTTATRELATRLCSAGIPYASEASLLDVDDANGRRRLRAIDPLRMMKRGVMSANYGLSRRFFCNFTKVISRNECMVFVSFISVITAVVSLFRHHHGLYALKENPANPECF